MDLNFKHLRYFWQVAECGSITAACEILHLTPQTVSSQLRLLEDSLGTALFSREGRQLKLTEAGRQTLEYAQQIFSLGSELQENLQRRRQAPAPEFKVGIVDVVPKLIAYQLLKPSLQLATPMRICCYEDSQEALLAKLAIHQLDLVLTDQPLDTQLHVRAYSHLLGDSDTSFFSTPAQASQQRADFPRSLQDAPLLLPGPATQIHRGIKRWLSNLHIYPRIVGEFDDSALMKAFGQAGAGLFSAPSVISDEITRQYAVQEIGRTDQVREHFYAISTERHIRHPATLAVCNQGRTSLFHY